MSARRTDDHNYGQDKDVRHIINYVGGTYT